MGSDDIFKKAREARKANGYQRKTGNKGKAKPRILIVCEGKRTEPNYFQCFRPANIVVKGFGYNTDSLLREAIKIKNSDDLGFDQVWCVFDRDDFPAVNFNKAFELAKDNGIDIAYTNEAFELWYFLHFDYLDTGITRQQYIDKLDERLGRKYEKNSNFMYDVLMDRQCNAIKNAATLLDKYPKGNPEKDKPSTTVHLLVEELNKWNK